jgi:hypothetical protein
MLILLRKNNMDKIAIDELEYRILFRIYLAVKNLPFGKTIALPWCRESFQNLDNSMKDFENYLIDKLNKEEEGVIDFEEKNKETT